MDRLDNLLGALALTVADRMRASAGDASGSRQAALVTLLAHPGRSVTWLGAVLGLTDSGSTRLLDRLVADGLVRRVEGSDARRRELLLTPRGRAQARAFLARRNDALQGVTAGLSAHQREELERLLDPLVAGLADARLPALATCRLCDRDACSPTGLECPLAHTTVGDDPHS